MGFRLKSQSMAVMCSQGSRLNQTLNIVQPLPTLLYATRKDARQDVFDYIELLYNPKRKNGNNGMLSPIDFKDHKN